MGFAPNDADSRNRASSALKSSPVSVIERVCRTYLFPAGMVDEHDDPEQTHSGEPAVKEPPARSQSLPSYERAIGINKALSSSNVNVQSDPTPTVLSMEIAVGKATLNGVPLPIELGHVRPCTWYTDKPRIATIYIE